MKDLLRTPAGFIHERLERDLPVPVDNPRLLWPSISCEWEVESRDLPHFSDRNDLYQRYEYRKNVIPLNLKSFESAVSQAQICILVLDPHFDEVGVDALGPALESSTAWDIRLLTGSGDIDEQQRRKLNKSLTRWRNINTVASRPAEVHWSAKLDKHRFPFLHDRFAIIDGALWHFGSTVGGGHHGLTAASGPWSATKTRAKPFFEEC